MKKWKKIYNEGFLQKCAREGLSSNLLKPKSPKLYIGPGGEEGGEAFQITCFLTKQI